MQKIYIVTGVTGFVGGVLAKKLVEQGKKVVGLARCEQKAKKVLGDLDISLVLGDVRNRADLDKLFVEKNAEYVFIHTAAVVLIDGTKEQYADMATVNVDAIENIIQVCLEHNAKLIHVSSVHAITEPKKRGLTFEIEDFDPNCVHGPYAKTKAEGSRLIMDAIKNRGLNAVMVHPGGITGPGDYGDSHLTLMVADYLAGKIPAATSGGYDFVDVRDVCDGIIASENAKAGERYLLTNKYYSVRELLDTLYEISGAKKIKVTLPIWLAKLGLPIFLGKAKRTGSRPLYTAYSLYTLKSNSNYCHDKATNELGYNPRSLKESMVDTVEFLRKERPELLINPKELKKSKKKAAKS